MPRGRAWTTSEIAYLKKWAGRKSVAEIHRHVKRSPHAIEHMAARLGLSLRVYKSRLVWCPKCSKRRTSVDRKHGWCRVCRKAIDLAGREKECERALKAMPAGRRERYEHNETKRGTKSTSLGPVPILKVPEGVSPFCEARAIEQYYIALERWEYRRVKLQYDATKTRLMRMRKIIGTNPRTGT